MSNIIHVRSHQRRKPDKPRILDNETSQRLWDEFVGDVLIGELWVALQEPLGDPQFDDVSVTDKQRMRETM